MDHQLSISGKKSSRTSFWGKLFGTSKKGTNKERKHDDSFQRQNSLYHSFHCTSVPQEMADSQEESGTFTTLESSAFMDMHRDSGILFLNKNNITNCMFPREDDKHVQFAPTPMNKYYRVDVKAAPAKCSKNDENKENLRSTCNATKPARPILRRSRENLSHKESFPDHKNTTEGAKIKVNVSYVDGPQVKKTPTIPRTSTKKALFDRKNGSMPHLNVSGITKYGSLPRTSKEKCHSEDAYYVSSNQDEVNTKLFFPSIVHKQKRPTYENVPEVEFQEGFPRRINIPNCFSIPDLSRPFDQKPCPRQARPGSHQNRLSMGEPLKNGSSIHSGIDPRNLIVCYDPNCEVLKRNLRIRPNTNNTTDCPGPVSNADANVVKREFITQRQKLNGPSIMQQENGASTQLPDKSINEIGLPIATHRKSERCSATKHRSRSESPHYIPLSETYSSDKAAGFKKPEVAKKIPQQNCLAENYNFVKPDIPKQVHYSLRNNRPVDPPNAFHDNPVNKPLPVLRAVENRDKFAESGSHFVSQARKQAIRSSMYVQRKKFMNKLCKYKSKECEDGFSSMADDECSFNCSCTSCISKFSREYRTNMNKNTLGLTDDDKFFFVRTEHESREFRSLPSVPEVVSTDDDSKYTSEVETAPEQTLSTTWYECNDSLCKTPVSKNLNPEEQSKEQTSQENKAVQKCIYENITQLINSATKQNFKPQEVERMFSTPVSTAKFRKHLEKSASGQKLSRALFPSEDNPPATDKRKKGQSPAKSPIVFSDSVILLQEIFQKLSQECKELLQPGVSSDAPRNREESASVTNSGNKYISDLVKNLRSKEISEGDFANIIGGIAQNIFLEAKLKNSSRILTQSTSLPDLTNDGTEGSSDPKLKIASYEDIVTLSGLQIKAEDAFNTASDSGFKTDGDLRDDTVESSKEGSSMDNATLGDRHLPDGWSRTPTAESDTSSSAVEKSTSDKENSKSSESEMQLLENAIRLGMGLSPISKVEKSTFFSSSPAKANKYKSRDVLSGKGKLKLKIYHNSGLVTVQVIRGAKLNRLSGRDLNPYIKISMVPDSSKRVHWRTTVQRGQKNPVFNQKFSFEILAEDSTKRLVFSVWHRDLAKERSELVGCMSFSVRHVMDSAQKIDGWYRLLREGFGTQKHFAARARNNQCSKKCM